MTMKRWGGSSFIDLTTVKRWSGSAWVTLTTAKRWSGSAWVDVALPGGGGGSLIATASPGAANGFVFVAEPASLTSVVTSNNVTVTAAGGTAPYTYSWTKVSGDTLTVTAPTADTTQFTATLFKNTERAATYRCTVTDALLATDSVDVAVFLSYSTDL